MNNNTSILNYNFYNNEMKKGLEDKLFFMQKGYISNEIKTIIDYGCADGALINEMSELYKKIKFIGFDIDSEMIERAKSKKINNAVFFDNFKDVKENNKNKKEGTAILCSSVIHEVYSYGTEESIKDFWFNLNNGDHEYIIIRDMCLSEKSTENMTLNIEFLNKILKYGNEKQIKEFQEIWGEFKTTKQLVHFLYKYRYVDNWSREVTENYFPINIEDYSKLIDMSKFEVLHLEHYLLPYQKEIIEKDFKISLSLPTHLKLILRRKK